MQQTVTSTHPNSLLLSKSAMSHLYSNISVHWCNINNIISVCACKITSLCVQQLQFVNIQTHMHTQTAFDQLI